MVDRLERRGEAQEEVVEGHTQVLIEGIEYLNPMCTYFSEDRLWIQLNANYFGFNKHLLLCLVHVSPETSTHSPPEIIFGTY